MKKFSIFTRGCFIFLILAFLSTQTFAQEDADSTKKDYGLKFNGYPFAFYSPETEFAAGGGGVMTFYMEKDPELNPSKLTFSGWYASVKAYQLLLKSSLYFEKNTIASDIELRFVHEFDKFYGVGNNTPDLGNESFFIDNFGGKLNFQMPPTIFIATRTGLVFEYRDFTIVDNKDNPYLNSDISFPGKEGGPVSGLGMVWVWDNRDNVFFPNKGGYTNAEMIIYSKDIGSDYTFTTYEVDTRRFWAFSPDHVFAVQGYFMYAWGEVPFYKAPALGGSDIMRGYFGGRYRDRTYLAAQMEYRQYFWWRFGFVAFAGIGDVARDVTKLQTKYFKPSYGIGLRFLFNKEEKINLRVDLGLGKDTSGLYFGIEEAF
jgi:outer membrane protein assembly factor BamA